MLMMVLLQRHQLRGSQPALFFVAALAPFLVIVGAEQAAAPVVHAGDSSSLMGRHMFAKAALIDAPPAPPSHDRAACRARRASADRLRADSRVPRICAPRSARGADDLLRDLPARRLRRSLARADAGHGRIASKRKRLGTAAMARIRRAPLAFARLTVMNYQSLWTVDRLRHPDRAAAADRVHRLTPADAVRGPRLLARSGRDARVPGIAAGALPAMGD